MYKTLLPLTLGLILSLSACAQADPIQKDTAQKATTQKAPAIKDDAKEENAQGFVSSEIATLNEPWAMTFLPNGKLLVTEKSGQLLMVSQTGKISEPINNVPAVAYGGQGGLGDVILHPDFATNKRIYLVMPSKAKTIRVVLRLLVHGLMSMTLAKAH